MNIGVLLLALSIPVFIMVVIFIYALVRAKRPILAERVVVAALKANNLVGFDLKGGDRWTLPVPCAAYADLCCDMKGTLYYKQNKRGERVFVSFQQFSEEV